MSRSRRERHYVWYSLTKARRNFRQLVRNGDRLAWVSLDAVAIIRDAVRRDREWPPASLKPAHRAARRRWPS